MKISERTRIEIDAEIAAARNDIRTDKLDMSYGELAYTNLYENKELVKGLPSPGGLSWTRHGKT